MPWSAAILEHMKHMVQHDTSVKGQYNTMVLNSGSMDDAYGEFECSRYRKVTLLSQHIQTHGNPQSPTCILNLQVDA